MKVSYQDSFGSLSDADTEFTADAPSTELLPTTEIIPLSETATPTDEINPSSAVVIFTDSLSETTTPTDEITPLAETPTPTDEENPAPAPQPEPQPEPTPDPQAQLPEPQPEPQPEPALQPQPEIPVAPATAYVTKVISPILFGAFKTGIVPIMVLFDKPIKVSGSPQLVVSTGEPATAIADYKFSFRNLILFLYQISPGNYSSDLDYSSSASLVLNGGQINDNSGNPANLTLPQPGAEGSLSGYSNIIINTNQ